MKDDNPYLRPRMPETIESLEQRVRMAKLKKELATLEDNPGGEARNGEPVSLVNWSGTQIDLGRWIVDAYAVGNIDAETARQALMQAVEHFTINGRPVNARSLDAELRKADLYKPAEERRRNLRIA
jgi:hypothetical protein